MQNDFLNMILYIFSFLYVYSVTFQHSQDVAVTQVTPQGVYSGLAIYKY